MRIAQISDVHFTHVTWNPLRLFSKRLAGVLNWIFLRKSSFNSHSLSPLPALFKELGVDLVLFAGDLSSTSLPEEFHTAKIFFDRIKSPKIFIPGNHDQYTRKSEREKQFYRTFANHRSSIDHPAEFFTLSEHGVEAHKIGPSLWCVALDTAPATSLNSSNGHFSLKVENYLQEVLQSLPVGDQIILLNHFPFFQNDRPKHRLIRGEHLRELLERHPNIRLYLHGHTHRHTIADLQPNGLPLILDSGCPVQKSLSTWNLIDWEEDGCKVEGYKWDGEKWRVFREQSVIWRE